MDLHRYPIGPFEAEFNGKYYETTISQHICYFEIDSRFLYKINSFTFKESVVLPFSCTKYSNETYAETSCEEEYQFVCVVGKGLNDISNLLYVHVKY